MRNTTVLTMAIFAMALLSLSRPSSSNSAKSNLEYLLSQRMSVRSWSDLTVADETMRTICRNSLSTAFDLTGIELYVLNSSGIYEYSPESDLFISKSSSDTRQSMGLAIGQTFIANAPCIITVLCDNNTEPEPLDAYRKAGLVAQNLYILAVRHDLGGVCVGGDIFTDETTTDIQQLLDLPSELKPLLVFPLGYLLSGQSYPVGDIQPTQGNLPSPMESSVDALGLFQNQRQPAVGWENVSLPQNKLSNMLWSTYGYSLLGTGHRTIASAFGEYPFQMYVCNQTGVYNYTAESHSLFQTGSGDRRSDLATHAYAPAYLGTAPTLLVFCWNSQVGTHNASDSFSGGRFINLEYGSCIQNLYLSAVLWNASVSSPHYTDAYDTLRNDLSESLPSTVYPMYLIGLGEMMEDKQPPLIGTPISLPSSRVQPNQEVAVWVNVTDVESGIENVTLSYTIDNGTSWVAIAMSHNASADLYEAIIPGQQAGTMVKYEIIAFDQANNKAVENNLGQYFVYSIIPEFGRTTFRFMLMFSAILVLAKKRFGSPSKNEHT